MSRVSIIIPCRDDGTYLAESVRSARMQTHDDCEIIVVDDHSTDAQTITKLSDIRNQGITVLTCPDDRRGAAAARNVGIAHASGDYILPLDADDLIEPDYVRKAAAVLDSRPEVGICYCKADFFGLKRGAWRLPPYRFEDLLIRNIIFISALFRKTQWRAAGGFTEDSEFGFEDHMFWLSLADLGIDVVRLDEVLFHYRIKPHSRLAAIGKWQSRRCVALQTFNRHQQLYQKHADILYARCIELDQEKQRRESLLLWKILSPLFDVEFTAREWCKRLLGR